MTRPSEQARELAEKFMGLTDIGGSEAYVSTFALEELDAALAAARKEGREEAAKVCESQELSMRKAGGAPEAAMAGALAVFIRALAGEEGE